MHLTDGDERTHKGSRAQLLHTASSRYLKGTRKTGDKGGLVLSRDWCSVPLFFQCHHDLCWAQHCLCQTTCSGKRPHLLKTSSKHFPRHASNPWLCFRVRGDIILNPHCNKNKGTSNSLFQRKIPGRGLGKKSKNKAGNKKERETERECALCLVLFPFDICYILPENHSKAPLTGFLLVGWRCWEKENQSLYAFVVWAPSKKFLPGWIDAF